MKVVKYFFYLIFHILQSVGLNFFWFSQQISGKSQRIVTESAAEVRGVFVFLERADRTLHSEPYPLHIILAHPAPPFPILGTSSSVACV